MKTPKSKRAEHFIRTKKWKNKRCNKKLPVNITLNIHSLIESVTIKLPSDSSDFLSELQPKIEENLVNHLKRVINIANNTLSLNLN